MRNLLTLFLLPFIIVACAHHAPKREPSNEPVRLKMAMTFDFENRTYRDREMTTHADSHANGPDRCGITVKLPARSRVSLKKGDTVNWRIIGDFASYPILTSDQGRAYIVSYPSGSDWRKNCAHMFENFNEELEKADSIKNLDEKSGTVQE